VADVKNVDVEHARVSSVHEASQNEGPQFKGYTDR
jgi:hypothetical protein